MAINLDSHKFIVPERKVLCQADIAQWEKSQGYQDLIGFLMAMNESVRGRKLSATCQISESCKRIVAMLEVISCWVNDILPLGQPQRYGNKAFKQLYDKLKQNGKSLLKEHIDEKFHQSIPEISVYLIEGFGNSVRIDYGTGHELSFVMFLCCLHKLGVLERSDSITTVNHIFKSYLDLTRKVQSKYKMEPAGSQGVWSLDDFQFIPFYWGSSQFIMNAKITPDMFTIEKVVEENYSEYMFLGCIKYILQVKIGPFAEHSNQLWNISGVPSWTKVNQGLLKMYKAEILNRYPIIQHVLFGSLISIELAEGVKNFSAGSTFLTKGLSSIAVGGPSIKHDLPTIPSTDTT